MFTSPTPPDFALERSMPSAPGQFTALKEQKYASAPKETLGSNNSVLPEAPNEIVVAFSGFGITLWIALS
ncbi:DNA topoisomerase 3 [Dissostichus eleginoides]|uniref:DNA topoisomerase 3 n=1 Tax=Dissostichus eleginoides TaxID=100907 RepID=A0AAD9BBB5_DISEL|nr:DNA topoisomerase 3 [Dissostichus eleginoides]